MGILAVLRNKVGREEVRFENRVKKTLEVIIDEDPISLLRRKVLCALEYTGNYQEVLLENGRIAEVEKMEKFARDRVRDALVHAGFTVPPLDVIGHMWGDACFDAVGVSSRYLILGEVKWGDELTEVEMESFISRAKEAEKNGRGREIVLFIASLRRLGEGVRQVVERHPSKNFVVSFEEVRPYPL